MISIQNSRERELYNVQQKTYTILQRLTVQTTIGNFNETGQQEKVEPTKKSENSPSQKSSLGKEQLCKLAFLNSDSE